MTFATPRIALYPWTVKTQTAPPFDFPFLNQSPSNSPTTEANGTNPYNTTPYLQQWNLSIQREIMKNTVLTVAYVGSHGVHLLGQRDSESSCGDWRSHLCSTGALQFSGGQTVYPSFPGEFANLVSAPSQRYSRNDSAVANGGITCTGARQWRAVSPPRTGSRLWIRLQGNMVFSHILQTSSYSVQANSRVNPNFSFLNNGVTDLWSRYDALQLGVVRRMTNNLSRKSPTRIRTAPTSVPETGHRRAGPYFPILQHQRGSRALSFHDPTQPDRQLPVHFPISTEPPGVRLAVRRYPLFRHGRSLRRHHLQQRLRRHRIRRAIPARTMYPTLPAATMRPSTPTMRAPAESATSTRTASRRRP